MGPITLFDKSFLQSLNLDEAIWFDNFFLTNISPLFFAETLADLEKAVQAGRTPEQEVGIIASKTPEMNSSPSLFHISICIDNLLGYEVPMDGRIVRVGGRPVRTTRQSGVVFEESQEAQAFARWQDGEFLEVERKFAKEWRAMLSALSFDKALKNLNRVGIAPGRCQSLEEAKQIAQNFVLGGGDSFGKMNLSLVLLCVPSCFHEQIFKRWKILGYKPMRTFAPYAAFVLTVDVFFYIAAAANLISAERVTNKIDLAYLFYLPFCNVFTSSDKIHRRCTPLFLREDQQFVWGFELKDDLKQLNKHYNKLPQLEKEKGLYAIAGNPPKEGNFLVSNLWDRFFPNWRKEADISMPHSKNLTNTVVGQTEEFTKAKTLNPEEVDFDVQSPDSTIVTRKVKQKRGEWWQLPKGLKNES